MKLNKEKLETQITDGVDERVKQANDSALAAVGIVSIFCVLISLLYRLYTDQNPLPDLISVVVMMITYTVVSLDRKSTRLNSSHPLSSRMPSSA